MQDRAPIDGDAAWLSGVRAAADAWPAIARPADGFVEHARAQRAAGGAALEHLGELFLAWAAAEGDPVAVRHVNADYLTRIDAVVRNIDPNDTFLDEVRQALRVTLLVGGHGQPPRIGTYQGRGPLVAWIRVAAIRAALTGKRARHERRRDAGDELLAELVAGDPDPELQHLKATHRAEFARALREALAALPERSRVVLRLHFVEGVTLARIGVLYRVHESTVSRWLARAAADVAGDAQRRLHERLALSPQTFDSLARLLRSGLDLSISRLLGAAEDRVS